MGEPSPDDNIPAFESIFCNSDEEESDGDDEGEEVEEDEDNVDNNEGIAEDGEPSSSSKSRRQRDSAGGESRLEKFERRINKQRERRQWESERDRLLFEYSQFAYYGRSSSLSMFELAWKLSKDTMDLLWWGIVGITELLLMGKIESSSYTLELDHIQSHVNRLTNKMTNNDHTNNMTLTKITFENDLHLVLYKHWSVIESMRYSRYSACKLRLWTLRGEKKLYELLVEMGLPLAQARQTFNSMDLILRQEFYKSLAKLCEKYGIPDIIFGSFSMQYGYRNRYSAADFVYGLLAILESIKPNRSPEHCFMEALDSLSRTHKEFLNAGINSSKSLHEAIFKQVQSTLEGRQIHSTGSFYYFILNEENTFFSLPYGLTMLARFLLHGHAATSRSRDATNLPLIASCPLNAQLGICLLVGIPPVAEDSSKHFFGKAFEQAAHECNVTILQDSFDTGLIQIRQNDITRFLDALTVLFT